MFLGAGFSHKNLRGDYYLEDGFIKFTAEDEIVDVYNNIVNSASRPIFLEFASIDINQEEQVVEFCKKYGRIGIYDWEKSEHRDARSYKTRSELFGRNTRHYYDGYEDIQDYIDSIILMKAAIAAKGFIDSANYVQAYIEYIKIRLTPLFQNVYSYGYVDYDIPDELYYAECSVLARIAEKAEDLVLYTELGDFDVKYDDVFKYDRINNTIISKYDCSLQTIISTIPHNVLVSIILNEIITVINYYIKSVSPCMSLRENNIRGFWKANSLLSAMYMELFLYFSSNAKVRQCKNKTCRKLFEINGNDTRKIYCSNSCAQLEAKRKQRERQAKEAAANGQHNTPNE